MPLLVYQLVQDHLPGNRKSNAKGWQSFDAVCCHHRGHNPDKRTRGNVLFSTDGSIVYNSYNCNFSTVYRGIDISDKFESFLNYLNVPKYKIQQAKLEILDKKLKGELISPQQIELKLEPFKEIKLPEKAKKINLSEPSEIVTYLKSRGRAVLDGYQYYVSDSEKWNLNKRIIIPFWYQTKIVGWTGRYIGIPPEDVPRYFTSDVPAGYLFNSDVLFYRNRKYVLIAEGPFDAIAINGVGALGSKLNATQISWLNSFDIEKIVVPDRQRKNQELIDIALEEGWSVSFPDWEASIKDAAKASQIYGKLYTIHSIVLAKTASELQINFKRTLLKDG